MMQGFMLLAPSRDCVMERLGGDGSHVSNSLTEVSRIFGDVVHQLYSWMVCASLLVLVLWRYSVCTRAISTWMSSSAR